MCPNSRVSRSRNHSEYGFGDLKPYYLGTRTLWVSGLGYRGFAGVYFKKSRASGSLPSACSFLNSSICSGVNWSQGALLKRKGLGLRLLMGFGFLRARYAFFRFSGI